MLKTFDDINEWTYENQCYAIVVKLKFISHIFQFFILFCL